MRFLFALFLFLLPDALAAQETYCLVRFQTNDFFTKEKAEKCGMDFDHVRYFPDGWIEGIAPKQCLVQLGVFDVPHRVLVPDVESWYESRFYSLQKQDPVEIADSDPPTFALGNYAGFYALDEIYDQMEKLHELYPDIVGKKEIIGNTVENRPIFAYRVGAPESDYSPQTLLTSLHHAREPGSAMAILYFLHKIGKEYAEGSAEIQYLLRRRTIFVIPVVNPDGYVYNQQTSPNGFGMWRKNRRPNSDGTYGVDLNRNYGPAQMWSASNGGSSENPNDFTYRGTEYFSEPETQALRDFVLKKKIRVALNIHTYSNLLIYPWGFSDRETADSLTFHALAYSMTEKNKYSSGRGKQTLMYFTRGTAEDWMHFDGDKQTPIFSFTPEAGTIFDGFYPPINRILPICRENYLPIKQAVWGSGSNVRVKNVRSKNASIDSLCVELYNAGVDTSPRTMFSLTFSDEHSESKSLEFALPEMQSAEHTLICLPFPPDTAKNLWTINIAQYLSDSSGNKEIDTFLLRRRPQTIIDIISKNTLPALDSASKWRILTDKKTNEPYLSDSPDGNSLRGNNYFLFDQEIDLRNADDAYLEFEARWEIEANYDAGIMQFSTNNGRTWEYLEAPRMRIGLGLENSKQETNAPVYDGAAPEWVYQRISLEKYIGKTAQFRVGVLCDETGGANGMELRNILLSIYRSDANSSGEIPPGNEQPTIDVFPQPYSTGNGYIFAAVQWPRRQLLSDKARFSLWTARGEHCNVPIAILSDGNELLATLDCAALSTGAYFLSVAIDDWHVFSPILVVR